MNYLKELKAFKEWVTYQEISTNSIALWHTLMLINNATGWKERFNVPSITITQHCRLSKQRLSEARLQLVELGLIKYESGRKGKAPVYEMIPIEEPLYKRASDLSADQPQQISSENAGLISDNSILKLHQTYGANSDQSRTILKHKPKQDKNKNSSDSNGPENKNPFIVYEQNYGILRPYSREAMISWCDEIGDQIVIHAIELAVKRGGRSFSYIEEILKDWSNAKLESIDQVLAYEQEKKLNKKNMRPFEQRKSGKQEALFTELREEAKVNDAKRSS
ncbi:DnaD domain protein [Oceanobacillus piezotolerans]|uniref:DnaD domain protein n=1 Tax=Oceanobacillus piezotolerans TaxID=2448030 RepID=A0A498D4U3_9BACI|nr:DnaD domain protein [Oceanobacillus piezotolerans]RLL43915.1 DnaD domain protein [Oceanobacillus piezotolerans]